ncbi:hypothetical protein ACFSQ3_15190 [Sphingobacterium corticis]|uniref:Uncharacterized protein n=1 Tax=Sphingobacterium corticis TaxID=1812823 RepID=A0ABW5NMQ0_9SPHI
MNRYTLIILLGGVIGYTSCYNRSAEKETPLQETSTREMNPMLKSDSASRDTMSDESLDPMMDTPATI